MRSDIFILPFNLGLYFILVYCIARCVIWFRNLSRPDKLRLQRGFFGRAFGQSLREIFSESLLHRRIFRVNPVLGYMHMSLAFGWFLLILFGTIEADILGERHLNPPHRAIFFRYYNPGPPEGALESGFTFLMDLILAFILSGLLIAVIKRIRSRVVGMKKTARHTVTDRIALVSLWLIFPSRLLAESFTSAFTGGGGFLTAGMGNLLAGTISHNMAMPFWWLYSLSLGTFFFLLPRTRYLHIPIELFLIFMRNSGISPGDRYGTYAEVSVHSCSSCGICLNSCQMSLVAGISNIQPLYLHKSIRNHKGTNGMVFNCLMCGRCEAVCPVGIETTAVRMIRRRDGSDDNATPGLMEALTSTLRKTVVKTESVNLNGKTHYPNLKSDAMKRCEVAFFAGCMTHLTPSVILAMEKIFRHSGTSYTFIDRDYGVCCGRPLMLAGQEREARELINHNSRLFRSTGARIIVTPCPICYRVFRESYYLKAEVMHHSQFISYLIESGRLNLRYTGDPVVWHDPCELGRGSGVYDEPRRVLSHIAALMIPSEEEANAVCCGGSLASLPARATERRLIAREAADMLQRSGAGAIATGCPLCKKSFTPVSGIPVMDIAEITANAMVDNGCADSRVTYESKSESAAVSVY